MLDSWLLYWEILRRYTRRWWESPGLELRTGFAGLDVGFGVGELFGVEVGVGVVAGSDDGVGEADGSGEVVGKDEVQEFL